MTLQEHEVSDVSALVDYMLKSGRTGPSWFRGHGCETWSLRTSLSRKLTSMDPTHVLQVEQRLITRFRQRSLALWPEGYPQNDWEHLFAMQHFGVPTRLLDWTESLLVGAYFAAYHEPKSCECGTGSCKPTLWVLNPVKLNQENPRLAGMNVGVLTTTDSAADAWAPGVTETYFAPSPIALYGTHNSPRIVAQQGTFTVGGKEDMPLDVSKAVASDDNVLEKIVINSTHQELIQQLRTLGVRRSTVYPDLSGLGYDITIEEVF